MVTRPPYLPMKPLQMTILVSELQTLHTCVTHLTFILTFHIAPGSVTKHLQKETKEKNLEEEKEVPSTEKVISPTDLPELHEVPMFEGMPLVEYDSSGNPRWNHKAIFALLSSLAHCVKDIYRFSSKLSLVHLTD